VDPGLPTGGPPVDPDGPFVNKWLTVVDPWWTLVYPWWTLRKKMVDLLRIFIDPADSCTGILRGRSGNYVGLLEDSHYCFSVFLFLHDTMTSSRIYCTHWRVDKFLHPCNVADSRASAEMQAKDRISCKRLRSKVCTSSMCSICDIDVGHSC
jgi:hypothetical protein